MIKSLFQNRKLIKINQLQISKLKLKKGDILVIYSEEFLSEEAIDRILASLKNILPKGVRAIIFERLKVGAILSRTKNKNKCPG